MRRYIFVLLIVAFACMQVLADDTTGSNYGTPEASAAMTPPANTPAPTAPGWTSDGTAYTSEQQGWVKVSVQRVAEKRTLTAYDYAQIECYRKYWECRGRKMTPSVRNGLELMLQLDVIHTPIYLQRTFEEIDLAYQIITQLLERIDWYIRILFPQKAPFTGTMLTATVDQWSLEKITLDKPTPPTATPPLPPKEKQAQIINRLCFEKTRMTADKMPYWQTGPVFEWRAGLLWMLRCPVCGSKQKTCGHWPGPGSVTDDEPSVPY